MTERDLVPTEMRQFRRTNTSGDPMPLPLQDGARNFSSTAQVPAGSGHGEGRDSALAKTSQASSSPGSNCDANRNVCPERDRDLRGV